ELLASLDHPGIVKTVAFGVLEDTGLPFVAMEWLDGEDLAARQRKNPLSIPEALELTLRVAEALSAAHQAGVIHRDIKPGNIFLCRQLEKPPGALLDVWPKLVDFGVASHGEMRVRRAGDLVGTPAYMAPEQARGDAPLDGRSDIYSLGATLFELIAGRPPHVGPNVIATLARLATTPSPHLSELRRDVPPVVDSLVQSMLETDPAERPRSAQELCEILRSATEDSSRTSWFDSEPRSTRLGSSGSRLITSIVALRFESDSARERALESMRQRGADAVPLGRDSIVAHLGARRAVGSEALVALELARRLARAGARVGLASGRAWVNLLSDSVVHPVGEVVDRASALARDAEPGTVLADVTTSELGRGRYEFRARDDGSAIVGEPLRGGRGDRAGGAPFVGRDAELAQVLSAFSRARSERTPILVTITGPPGIGKSRLRREVMARIAAQAEAPQIILQRSEAYGQGQSLGAAADVLRAIIGLPKGATSSEAARAIVARLGPATRDELTARTRDLVARLLANEPLSEGLDPRGSRDALWLAMTDLVMQITAVESTAILVEDLQWADPESIGWLDHLMGRAANRPLLVMAMVRPEFWTANPERFAGRDHVRLELRPISRRSARSIVQSVLGPSTPEAVLDRIAEQAGGLPLFAEELARLTAAGRDTLQAPTIQAAIQVSLDALDDECRDAVGRLSVLGLTCWESALEAFGMPGAEGVMKALVAHEVLVEQNNSRFSGTREWTFKHALVRDVAYASLGERERKELHALAGTWLASMGEDAAVVAGHFDLGAQHAAAAEHWTRAAQRALSTNALTDALNMAERALAFAEDRRSGFVRASLLDEAWSRLDPRASERESAIMALEANVFDEASAVRARGARARFDEARGSGTGISERLAETRDEAAALGLHDEEARCSAVLASRLAFAGRFAEAEAEVRRLLQLAEQRGISAAAVDAYQTQAIIRQTQGAVGAALESRRNAVAAAHKAALREREAMLMTNLGFALTTIGARQEARASLDSGLALADAIGSQGAMRNAQMNLLGWCATFGSDKMLDAHLAQVRTDADATASGIWAAPDRANLGILFYRGCELLRQKSERDYRRALGLLRMAAQGYKTTGHRDLLPVALGMWAEAERLSGNVSAAAELAREAIAMLERGSPSLLNESPVYLALHDALVDLGDETGARDAIRRGLPALARRLQALVGTPYARLFLTDLQQNARLVAIAEEDGLVPDTIHRVMEGGRS
ncbi:MAG TPA: AAA family ATPase, partial [Polyangiaceae bacterium]|nr:AAA family ATPase [Polyangiaceae bacterium]